MATTKIPDVNTTAKQFGEAGKRLVTAGKRAGSAYLDGYEKLIENVTTFQQKLAEQSNNEAVRSITATQVELTHQLASAYTSAARKFIL